MLPAVLRLRDGLTLLDNLRCPHISITGGERMGQFENEAPLRAATVSRDDRRAASSRAGEAAASCDDGAWSTLSRLRQLAGACDASPPASSPTSPES